MKAKKIDPASPLEIEFQFESPAQVTNFTNAFFKLCKIAGQPIGELISDEERCKVTFTGRIDNLCHIWYIIGTLAERSSVKHNMFQLN